MKPIARALFAALLACLPAAGARAQAHCDLMVDVSASMKGYKTAEGQPLLGLLDRLRGVCGKAYVFGDRLRALPAGAQPDFQDGKTVIDQQLGDWVHGAPDGAFVVLLTDNIPDDLHASNDPTQKFYALLRSTDSPFSHIVVMTLRAGFKGRLYNPHNERQLIPYSGPRALTVYLLGKRAEGDDAGFATLRRTLEGVLAGSGRHRADAPGATDDDNSYAVFDVKPFAKEAFQVKGKAADIRAEDEGATRAVQCSADARFDEATQSFLLIGQPMDQDCELRANLRVRFPDRWCLVDTGLSAKLSMRVDDPDVLKQSVNAVPVTPARASLCADEKTLSVGLRFSAFSFKDNVGFLERLARTFTGTFTAEGELTVLGSVARGNVDLGGGIQKSWSYGTDSDIGVVATPDRDTQRRVYQLDKGVRAIIPQEELEGIRLVHYPVKVEVRYDQSPLLLLLLGGLLLLALLVALIWLARRPSSYLVETEGGAENRVALGLFSRATMLSDDNRISMTLTNLLLFLLVTSNGRILRGRLLGSGGGRIEIAPPGTRPVRPRRSRRRDTDEEAGDYDDYADEPAASAGGAQDAIAFTVRKISSSLAQEGQDDEKF